jgi:peptidoglycan/xylan/chitin deacetylase (PgdA/CDA1 family)
MKKICFKKINKKIIIITFILLFLNIGIICIKGSTIEYSQREEHLISLYNDKKLLVLTFDDGPSKYTSSLLDMLNEKNVKVTFFVLGEQAEKFPELVQREYNEGHLVCIHSYTHKFFTKISKEQVEEQITLTQDILKNLIDYSPRYIRVPYGLINDSVESILKEYNLENILWNVDSLDWKYKEKNATVEHIKETLTGNDIILMHDIIQSSIESAKEIIDYYTNLGYEFVTIDEFLHIKNIVKSNV